MIPVVRPPPCPPPSPKLLSTPPCSRTYLWWNCSLAPPPPRPCSAPRATPLYQLRPTLLISPTMDPCTTVTTASRLWWGWLIPGVRPIREICTVQLTQHSAITTSREGPVSIIDLIMTTQPITRDSADGQLLWMDKNYLIFKRNNPLRNYTINKGTTTPMKLF